MNLMQIEKKVNELVKNFNQFEFIYDFLRAYNLPKASITRLRKGNLNLSKDADEIIWKKKLRFKEEIKKDLHETIVELEAQLKHNERFVIVTDYQTFLAMDTKTGDRLDIDFKDLPKHYDFFLPWAGMEKTQHANENPADVKAAERMAKLFDAIKKENPDDSPGFVHDLNVFLSRLLFCFFAEDTNIFSENQFTNAISSHTQEDGSDLDSYLNKLFTVLNTPGEERRDLPNYLTNFPYVNGGLFESEIQIPKFNRKARQQIIESGELNWSAINPDIFGSMFQAVIDTDQRGSLGQHYTSVPNIMKVIEPLFLNELKEVFENSKGSKSKLQQLLKRLHKIKVFDPACGSGNFLIIAYKELRRLEIEILEELKEIRGDKGLGSLDLGSEYLSHITLNNFYGIELDDFAHEIAKLALWLTEHQMNQEFFAAIGKSNPTLPLKDAGKIVCGNSTNLNWTKICPATNDEETYILGNPPYLGTRNQKKHHKEDMKLVLGKIKKYKSLDYILAWFFKASNFLKENTNTKFAFVSTNSICQGDQVAVFWPLISKNEQEIFFAHQSFKWTNNAKNNAGVTVVIIGIRNIEKDAKYIYTDKQAIKVNNINSYLVDGPEIIVSRKSSSISGLPKMIKGSIPADGGHLILDSEEAKKIMSIPGAKPFVKEFIGAQELIKDIKRYCLYITDENLDKALKIDEIKKRIKGVQDMRAKSTKKATRELAQFPNRFAEDRYYNEQCLLIPCVTSESRRYLPVGFVDAGPVIYASAQAVYSAEPWVFAIVNSRMHNIWVHAVGGKLESRIRYSSSLCYNAFPFPKISSKRKEELSISALRILDARQKYTEKNLVELYDFDLMPTELLEAHKVNDENVDNCYKSKPFADDDERLGHLFRLYSKMIKNTEA